LKLYICIHTYLYTIGGVMTQGKMIVGRNDTGRNDSGAK
jgi:hypothetical protein